MNFEVIYLKIEFCYYSAFFSLLNMFKPFTSLSCTHLDRMHSVPRFFVVFETRICSERCSNGLKKIKIGYGRSVSKLSISFLSIFGFFFKFVSMGCHRARLSSKFELQLFFFQDFAPWPKTKEIP